MEPSSSPFAQKGQERMLRRLNRFATPVQDPVDDRSLRAFSEHLLAAIESGEEAALAATLHFKAILSDTIANGLPHAVYAEGGPVVSMITGAGPDALASYFLRGWFGGDKRSVKLVTTRAFAGFSSLLVQQDLREGLMHYHEVLVAPVKDKEGARCVDVFSYSDEVSLREYCEDILEESWTFSEEGVDHVSTFFGARGFDETWAAYNTMPEPLQRSKVALRAVLRTLADDDRWDRARRSFTERYPGEGSFAHLNFFRAAMRAGEKGVAPKEVYSRLEAAAEAGESFSKDIAIANIHASYLARAAFGFGQYGLAKRFASQATKSLPKSHLNWFVLAASCAHLGNHKAALDALKQLYKKFGKVVDLGPDHESFVAFAGTKEARKYQRWIDKVEGQDSA